MEVADLVKWWIEVIKLGLLRWNAWWWWAFVLCILDSVSVLFYSFTFFLSEIIWDLSFSVQFISLNPMSSGFIHIVTNDQILLWWLSCIPLHTCATTFLPTRLLMAVASISWLLQISWAGQQPLSCGWADHSDMVWLWGEGSGTAQLREPGSLDRLPP